MVFSKPSFVFLLLTGTLCLVGTFVAPTPCAAGDLGGALLELAEGDRAWLAGDTERALQHYLRAAEAEPELARAHHRSGVVQIELGSLDDGIAHLERAAELAPEDPTVHLDLGLAYLQGHDLFWAADELALASQLAPDNAAAAYYEGLVLSELGEPTAAMASFERARDDAVYGSRASYYLGMAAANDDDLDGARALLTQVQRMEPDSAYGEAAAEASDLLVARTWDILPLFSGSLTLSGQYDSNVVSEPSSATVPLGAEAPGLMLRGRVVVAPFSTPTHSIWGSAAASRTNHFAEVPSQFNLTSGSLGVGYRGRLVALERTNTVGLAYSYHLGLLDGGELTDRPDFYAYREANTVTASYGLDDGERSATTIEITYRNAVFTDVRRDGHMFSGRVGETLMFWSQKLKLLFSLGGRYEDAFGDGYDLWAVTATTGISVLLPWSLQTLALFRYEHADHFDSAFYYGWGPGREDDVLTVSLAVNRTFREAVTVELAWVHTEHGSTATAFDYRRDLVSLGLRWVFP